MRFGKLEINPAKNPAILDTATWDPESAWGVVQSLDDAYWHSIQEAIEQDNPLPVVDGFIPHTTSSARCHGGALFLASLADGQEVFVEIGAGDESVLETPIGVETLEAGSRIAMYKTDAAVIDRFFRFVNPVSGPRAMGAVPRLGIGSRMTTVVWPGVFRAMDTCGFAANAIQNSVRELNLLSNLLAGRPADRNYAFVFDLTVWVTTHWPRCNAL